MIQLAGNSKLAAARQQSSSYLQPSQGSVSPGSSADARPQGIVLLPVLPNDAVGLGDILTAEGKHEKAEEHLERGQPDCGEAQCRAAVQKSLCEKRNGDIDRAQRDEYGNEPAVADHHAARRHSTHCRAKPGRDSLAPHARPVETKGSTGQDAPGGYVDTVEAEAEGVGAAQAGRRPAGKGGGAVGDKEDHVEQNPSRRRPQVPCHSRHTAVTRPLHIQPPGR